MGRKAKRGELSQQEIDAILSGSRIKQPPSLRRDLRHVTEAKKHIRMAIRHLNKVKRRAMQQDTVDYEMPPGAIQNLHNELEHIDDCFLDALR